MVEVAFVPAFTWDSLTFIKDDLAKRGIMLTYKKVEFDSVGCLTYIELNVDCGDGEGIFAHKKSFEIKEWSLKDPDYRCGFYRYYPKSVPRTHVTTFATGCLNRLSEDPLKRYEKLK